MGQPGKLPALGAGDLCSNDLSLEESSTKECLKITVSPLLFFNLPNKNKKTILLNAGEGI